MREQDALGNFIIIISLIGGGCLTLLIFGFTGILHYYDLIVNSFLKKCKEVLGPTIFIMVFWITIPLTLSLLFLPVLLITFPCMLSPAFLSSKIYLIFKGLKSEEIQLRVPIRVIINDLYESALLILLLVTFLSLIFFRFFIPIVAIFRALNGYMEDLIIALPAIFVHNLVYYAVFYSARKKPKGLDDFAAKIFMPVAKTMKKYLPLILTFGEYPPVSVAIAEPLAISLSDLYWRNVRKFLEENLLCQRCKGKMKVHYPDRSFWSNPIMFANLITLFGSCEKCGKTWVITVNKFGRVKIQLV